jgi:hypothetical protein
MLLDERKDGAVVIVALPCLGTQLKGTEITQETTRSICIHGDNKVTNT